jgi:hypothetical protein
MKYQYLNINKTRKKVVSLIKIQINFKKIKHWKISSFLLKKTRIKKEGRVDKKSQGT